MRVGWDDWCPPDVCALDLNAWPENRSSHSKKWCECYNDLKWKQWLSSISFSLSLSLRSLNGIPSSTSGSSPLLGCSHGKCCLCLVAWSGAAWKRQSGLSSNHKHGLHVALQVPDPTLGRGHWEAHRGGIEREARLTANYELLVDFSSRRTCAHVHIQHWADFNMQSGSRSFFWNNYWRAVKWPIGRCAWKRLLLLLSFF